MGRILLGMNLEATRHHDKPFEWGLDQAAELGYEYVEPMVHFGRELMSEAGYYHTVSMFNDPLVKGDIYGIMKELHRQRFQGVLGIEYDQRPADIEKDLAQCVAYFESVAKELT